MSYLIEAIERFYKESGFDQPENMEDYYTELLKNPLVFVKSIEGKGFIAGMIAPSFLHPGRLQCSELAWYVEPEYRGTSVAIKLMKMYEQHAKDQGCYYVSMVALERLNPEATGKIYEKLGYNRLENHYRKELYNGSI